ncbi:MAG: hypothetical protein K2M96_00855, partial [Prevotella sp.]|nr:hypothetical protein [Prevotella sp.]
YKQIKTSKMKTVFKVSTLLLWVLVSQVFTSCSKEEHETKEIYGTFNGLVVFTTQSSPNTPFVSYDINAILTLTKNSNSMSVSIKSTTDDSFKTTFTGLPLLDVKGDADYKYTYSHDTEYGSRYITISSPDFTNVKVTESGYFENGSKYSYEFNGVRIK